MKQELNFADAEQKIPESNQEGGCVMKLKRLVAMLSCIALIAAGAAGCGSGGETAGDTGEDAGSESTEGEKPDKITLISTTDDVGYFEYIGEQYTEKTGVELEIISQSYDDTKTKITTSVTGGNADIAYLDVVWPGEFADKGLILPLTDYFTDEIKSGIMEGNLQQMTVGDDIYGIPYCNNGMFMFYNKAMLEEAGYTEPPTTWDELKEMSQAMQEKGICKYGIAWPGQQAEGSVCNLSMMLYSFGGTWTEGDEFTFNSDAGVQAVQFMVDSINDGWADPSSVSYSDRDILDTFLAGDTAFVTNWSYAYDVANDPAQSQVAGDVDVCLIPGANGSDGAIVLGGGGLGVLATSEYPDYAWQFIEMLADPEIQEYGYVNHKMMPTIKSIYEDPDIQAESPELVTMYEQLSYPANRPVVPDYSEWSNVLQTELSSIMSGNEDVKTGLDNAYEQVKDYLK